MKVAIVGDAQSTRSEAPFDDSSWEIWGINHGWAGHPRQLLRCTRIFDIHDPRCNGIAEAWDDDPSTYGKAMRLVPRAYPGVVMYCHPLNEMWTEGNVRDFPFDAIIERYGRERSLLTSGVAWMIAFALMLEYPAVSALAIYGVDMDPAAEYSTQRTGGEYWVGRARERLGDANVIIPADSLLCLTPALYGIEDEANSRVIQRIDQRARDHERLLAQADAEWQDGRAKVMQMQARAQEIREQIEQGIVDAADPRIVDRLDYLADHERRWREQMQRATQAGHDVAVLRAETTWQRDNWTIPSPAGSHTGPLPVKAE